ncbi:acetyltransferase, GNAT family [Renibacterium salmoninarum ATCC 33209]|uniref:Acetyltransferase, GNAT family n=1 Tax=Renibacterium salmoninarum (strain ATCC 33209 / DSM 20767 / JCM 11484 / NBRC 15589 / NCIMB 2235) TaxID=288705 RepID=A9WQ69_RENSM|nr:GNAT family N-acetyltransferase [Renibacterium salmoninarum]ABY22509.1 acetyltransferase, GNAT family [Renibacterium salmoninarum ATCC 33209]
MGLYDSVGWSAYTKDPQALKGALNGSEFICVAEEDGQLLGLARAISDGFTVCYLQDVLVNPAWQRQGIGAELVKQVLAAHDQLLQFVLLTDDEPAQHAFYRSLGLTNTADQAGINAFFRFS